MNAIAPVLGALGAEVTALTAELGRRVDVSALGITDRRGQLALARPGLVSPNGACRLAPAADGWLAVNLAREEDLDLVPAWLGCDFGAEPWSAVADIAPRRSCRSLIADAILLGLPVSQVGEIKAANPEAVPLRIGTTAPCPARPLRVVDLSALWAGPMCGAILAAGGAKVVKVESLGRPDPTRHSTPEFFARLNGAKTHLSLDLSDPDGRARLGDLIGDADVVITGARPRGLRSLGLDVAACFAARPGLVWVAITGYGFHGEAAERVAFGDDAAAAGNLVGRRPDGSPRFLGDALADPLTGLSAAIGALKAIRAGGGVLVDAALARCAAGAAAQLDLRRAA